MKYIDSEKLIAEIERRIEETKSMKPSFDQFWAGQISAFKGAIKIAESLQQEQPLTTEQVVEQCKKFGGNPEVLKQEQQEVDLEKEIDRWFGEKYMQNMEGLPIKPIVQIIARHFYELGLNARKEE